MTPSMSLIMVGGLVAVLTAVQWRNFVEVFSPSSGKSAGFILRHMVLSGILGAFVWLVNLRLWQVQVDYGAVLGLLVAEGIVFGLLGMVIGAGKAGVHIPQKDNSKQVKRREKKSGVVRLEQTADIRGELRPGIGVGWDQKRLRWTDLDTALEDERNTLAG
ncbi:MAG TPA: hypothetical protein VH186_25910 [Chloroflexia bacterium]|nr:hypothetical protein [Chloroflexia bacterium]